MSEQRQHPWVIVQLSRLLILESRLGERTCRLVSNSQLPMSKVKVLIHLDRRSQLLDGFVVLMRMDVSIPQIRTNDYRKRIKLLCSFQLSDRFIESLHLRKVQDAIPMMSGCVVWIQFNGPSKFPFGFQIITIVGKEHRSE